MKTIGILGGGQLAAFLTREAVAAQFNVVVLDDNPRCPAALFGARILEGDVLADADVRRLATEVDVITIDREHVNVDALVVLEQEGTQVLPKASTLYRMTDKYTQKCCLAEHGIPTPDFVAFNPDSDPMVSPFGWPVVQKLGRGGYDGRGVTVLSGPEDNDLLRGDGYLEQWIECAAEIAVVVVRGAGKSVSYPAVEMVFNDANTLDYLVSPARLPSDVCDQATALAVSAVEAFGSDGVYGVEMFLDGEGRLFVNEIAPRTHNSGHHTMDAARVSQFGQQLRLLTGQPPAEIGDVHSAAMFNLLGIEKPDPDGLNEAAHIHWYGKEECFPGRKMGHVTVLGQSADDALSLAGKARHEIYSQASEATA